MYAQEHLSIKRHQARAHLTSLGYRNAETVYLRLFYPDGDSRKAEDKGRKLECQFPDLPWSQIEKMQADGRGCYFVVNGYGHTDADVRQCRAIFYEHDDLAKDLQVSLWQGLGLPEPTCQVDTGGKSIHSYWRLTTPCTPEQWKELQSDLLEFADGDRKLKNPSRVMRLAGAHHIKPGREPIQSQLILNTGKNYSYEELRAIIPKRENEEHRESRPNQIKWHEFEKNFRLPIDDQVPLRECLTRTDRDLLDRGAGEGERNERGFALAANLVATTDYLSSINQPYDGDPHYLFEEYCQKCTPPINTGEIETIWRSASQRAKNTSLPPDAIENCVKGWQWRQIRGETPQPSDQEKRTASASARAFKVLEHPTAKRQLPLTEEEVYQKIDELVNQDLPPSKLTAKLNLLAKETDFLSPSELKRIYYERVRELELIDNRLERTVEIDDLLKIGGLSLKLSEELPATYAKPLIMLAQHLSLREEVYLLALLAGLSICHRTGTELIIHHGQGFTVPLNLFAGIIAESGQRKSPVIKAIITNPLRVLQREAKAEHKAAVTNYEADLERWSDLDREERETEFPEGKPQAPPQQRIYYFTSTSGSESINRQIAAHPDQPLLYLKDELMGVFTQQGKYTQGRGSEKQDFLSYYDGVGSTELLADGVKSDTEIILMSIFGSVQPEVLRKFTKDCSDPDGQWARFLWVNQPLVAATLRDDAGGNVEITDLLAGLYRRVCELPATKYTLSREAFKLYQKVYDQIEQLRVNCPDPGLRAVYSKMTGQLGRLVANCHVIHELAAGQEVPSEEIPLERMQQGIRLIKFFIEQVKIIRSESNAAQGEVSEILTKIILLSQRLGRIKAKQVQMNYKSLNLSADQIRNSFLELKAMGYGPTYGAGNRLEWEYKPTLSNPNLVGRTVGTVGDQLADVTTARTTQYQGSQETVGKVGTVGVFSENSITGESKTNNEYNPEVEHSDFSDFSPTAPTAPTVFENQDGVGVPAVGTDTNCLPTVPTVFQEETAEVATALQVNQIVRLPDGQVGVVGLIYPDGQVGVGYEDRTKFGMWRPSQLTVVTTDDDDDLPDSDRIPPSGGDTPPLCNGLFQLSLTEDYWAENSSSESEINKGGEDKGETSPPITIPEAQLQQDSQPPQHPSPTHHNPSSQPEAIAPNPQQPEAAVPPGPLQVGDSVVIDNLGSKHHGKRATVTRIKTEHLWGQQLRLADLNIPGERRYVEVQISWLRRVEVFNE